ncbi:MAG: rod shape-determining protein MreC [Bacteroidales bacterium]|nr:rod shape-determining protein MreC [Bacteroidales bacterium]MCR5191858.1 rod shape-determining protein MreC [Bacteroidales bacterium]
MEKLFEFIKKHSHIIVFIILEIVAIILIAQNTIYQRSRIIRCGNAIAGRWHNGVSSITGYFGLKAENEHLAAENARLRAQLETSYISYSDSVFRINDTVYKQRYTYTDAMVIKNSYNKSKNYMMINKGSDQGIKTDMAVLSPQGIVGIVVNCTRNFSTIMPVLHTDSRNSVKLKQTNSTGSLIWEGGDYRYATVLDIPTTYPLHKNDTIVTSGLANGFPEGIPVGYIDEFENLQGSGFYTIRIRLATDFNNLNHVYIVNNHFKEEQDKLMKKTEESDE